MVKLIMYLVSSAPRANNYLIQIIAQKNFAQVETWTIEGTYTGRHACTHDGRKLILYIQYNINKKNLVR